MKCHICGNEMHIVKTIVIDKNDIAETIEQYWRCDHCDGWINKLRRWLKRGK